MKLTEQELLHVAKLAALELSPEELVQLRADLEPIIDYINQLSSVPTVGVRPTSHVHGAINEFRDDITEDSLPLTAVRENAPDFAHGGFRVPRVI